MVKTFTNTNVDHTNINLPTLERTYTGARKRQLNRSRKHSLSSLPPVSKRINRADSTPELVLDNTETGAVTEFSIEEAKTKTIFGTDLNQAAPSAHSFERCPPIFDVPDSWIPLSPQSLPVPCACCSGSFECSHESAFSNDSADSTFFNDSADSSEFYDSPESSECMKSAKTCDGDSKHSSCHLRFCARCGRQTSHHEERYSIHCRKPNKRIRRHYTISICHQCHAESTKCPTCCQVKTTHMNNIEPKYLYWGKKKAKANREYWHLECEDCKQRSTKNPAHNIVYQWTRCDEPTCKGLYKYIRGKAGIRSVERHRRMVAQLTRPKLDTSETALEGLLKRNFFAKCDMSQLQQVLEQCRLNGNHGF